MKVMVVTIVAFTVSLFCQSPCFASIVNQNIVASILQDILSPANTQNALQLINTVAMRANKNIAVPEVARAVASTECGLPGRAIVASNNQPPRIIAKEMGLPRAIVTSDGVARVISPEMGYPGQANVVRQIIREQPKQNIQPNYAESLIIPREIYNSAPISMPQETVCPHRIIESPPSNLYTAPTFSYLPVTNPNPILPVTDPFLPTVIPGYNPFLPVPATNSYLPGPATNPYLPVASPVSAMSLMGMPPPTQSKGQFLRKIPIPPPSL